jgi:hypothetical protein
MLPAAAITKFGAFTGIETVGGSSGGSIAVPNSNLNVWQRSACKFTGVDGVRLTNGIYADEKYTVSVD